MASSCSCALLRAVCLCVQRYEFLCRVGEGAYGSVWKCQDKETGELVAVKKLKDAPTNPEVGGPGAARGGAAHGLAGGQGCGGWGIPGQGAHGGPGDACRWPGQRSPCAAQ